MPRLLLFFIACCSTGMLMAQDSSRLRISLLTCAPGEELYATFGHTALRVTDSTQNSDIVYNYGTFNFEDEGFYIKFIQGKLPYYLATEYFGDFLITYQMEGRGITEQLLQMSGTEKKQLQQALEKNLLPANKFYQYDFFFDNCTTRARDMLLRHTDSTMQLPAVMPKGTRFRQALHTYLDAGGQHWSKLGIDLLMGAPADAVMTTRQMQFLPDNLLRALDSSNGQYHRVASTQSLYSPPPVAKSTGWLVPWVVFAFVLLCFVLLSFIKNNVVQVALMGLDGLLFFFIGLLGIILLFMWTGTNHTMFRNNYNLLWALPTHIIIAFLLGSNKRWVKIYFGGTAILMVLLLATWIFVPQQLNNGLLPLVLLLLYRSFRRYYQHKNNILK